MVKSWPASVRISFARATADGGGGGGGGGSAANASCTPPPVTALATSVPVSPPVRISDPPEKVSVEPVSE